MSNYAARNRVFFGARQVKVDDKSYSLDWGSHRITITDGEKKISLSNQHLADRLGRVSLQDFITREFRRAA